MSNLACLPQKLNERESETRRLELELLHARLQLFSQVHADHELRLRISEQRTIATETIAVFALAPTLLCLTSILLKWNT